MYYCYAEITDHAPRTQYEIVFTVYIGFQKCFLTLTNIKIERYNSEIDVI